MKTVKIVKADKYGRVLLPAEYRRDVNATSFIVTIEGELLTLRPLKVSPLTAFSNSVEVDVNPQAFSNYDELKKALLGGHGP